MASVSPLYMCSGTMQPNLVRGVFSKLLPIWQSVDLAETQRLEDARSALGPCITKPELACKLRDNWPGTAQAAVNAPGRDLSLALIMLSPGGFLPFFRFAEDVILDEKLPACLTYWSRSTAARLLPGGVGYRSLIERTFCVSIFSEDHCTGSDEWGMLVESHDLCFFVYGTDDDGGKPSKAQNVDPRFIDSHDYPHSSGVPRRPFPADWNTGVALPEPIPEGGTDIQD